MLGCTSIRSTQDVSVCAHQAVGRLPFICAPLSTSSVRVLMTDRLTGRGVPTATLGSLLHANDCSTAGNMCQFVLVWLRFVT